MSDDARAERDALAKHLEENGDHEGLYLLGEIEEKLGLEIF